MFYRARPPGPWPACGAREVEAPRGIGAAEVEREQSCARVAASASLKARLEATRALAELVGAGGENKNSVSATVGAYAIWCDGGPTPQTRAPPPAASVK